MRHTGQWPRQLPLRERSASPNSSSPSLPTAGLEYFRFSGTTINAATPALTGEDTALWRGVSSVQPIGQQPAFGLFAEGADGFIAAAADPTGTTVALIPRSVLLTLNGHLRPVFTALTALPPPVDGLPVAPLTLTLPSWSSAERLAACTDLIDALGGGTTGGDRALAILATALHERGAILYGFHGDGWERLRWISGWLALLPASIRPDFTFSTNRHESMTSQARLVFAERHVSSARWPIDQETLALPNDHETESAAAPFIDYLRERFAHDPTPAALLATVDRLNTVLLTLHPPGAGFSGLADLQRGLAAAAGRAAIDSQIASGGPVSPADLIAAFKTAPPTGDLKLRYAERLLDHGLRERNAAAAQTVATLMDADPALDAALWPRLNRLLGLLPDAAYAFIRAHLTGRPDANPCWRTRLKLAALASLRVAVLEGDTETLLNWLTLIAREPAAYDLTEVLRNALPAAHTAARERGLPPELVRGLVLIAARRDGACAASLLADADLIAALPDTLGAALRDHTGDPAALLAAYGVEVLLLALHRAAAVHVLGLFNPLTIETVWALSHPAGDETASPSPAAATATAILADWLDGDDAWLPTPALATLLTLALRDQRDDQFHRLARPLHERDDFPALIASALSRSQRPIADALALIAQMLAVGDLSPQGAVAVYTLTLTDLNWERSAQPMIAQLARSLGQQPALTIPDEALWRLVEAAADLRDEAALRAASRRCEGRIRQIADEATLIDQLARLVPLVGLSSARAPLEAWWREFVSEQPLLRLQKFDRQFEGRKGMDDLRQIVQSVIAFRRMVGGRTLEQFIGDVATTYAVLQALSDSFEPSVKRATAFDAATIRAEIDAHTIDISPEQIQIFARNLKGLAELIAALGDSRSKAGLIRRSEDVDRQLITGEQDPHGAVDALKWMSGYLSGAQDSETADAD